MSDDEKLDLSALDPAADRERWERRIQAIASAGLRAVQRRRAHPVVVQLATWARPVAAGALLAAASVAAVVTVGLPATRRSTVSPETATATATTEPGPALLQWASKERVPSATELFNAFDRSTDERATP